MIVTLSAMAAFRNPAPQLLVCVCLGGVPVPSSRKSAGLAVVQVSLLDQQLELVLMS